MNLVNPAHIQTDPPTDKAPPGATAAQPTKKGIDVYEHPRRGAGINAGHRTH
jgi:hypothetical protein